MGWTLAAALLAAFAVWLALGEPLDRRLVGAGPTRLPSWLAPVPDALGARQRGLAGVTLGVAVVAWTGHLGPVSAVFGVLAGGLGFVLLGRVAPASRARRNAALTAALPQACDLMAVAVEAGLPVRAAVEAIAPSFDGPLGEVLSGVAARISLGTAESVVWAELGEPSLAAVSRELSRVAATGLGAASVLRQLAIDARRTAATAALVKARRVGVRSVMPLMICFLPSFILLGIVPLVGSLITNLLP